MIKDKPEYVGPSHAESSPLSPFPGAPPVSKPASNMREFLESGLDFEWPAHVGQCSGSHCLLSDIKIPLVWERRISDTKGALIDVYRGGPEYTFKEAFVVKTIRGKDDISSRKRAAREVENMKDLRHPHVAALLGTFLHEQRLSILIYPVACCDLRQFLRKISKALKNSHGNLSDVSQSSASTDSAYNTSNPATRSRGEIPSHHDEESCPLNSPLTKAIDHLRRFFVCLSQALAYIHESDVRHKDIKPANVLIDSSGSAILTDFGISRRFAPSTSHVTNDRWELTRKYASPEIMKGTKVPRDDPSDVFSLGCVFLEMMTPILGIDQDKFCAFYGRNGDDAYFCNLEKVNQWIGVLEGSKQLAGPWVLNPSLTNEKVESHDFMPGIDQGSMDSLATIRRMLNEDPSKRPVARELWKNFQTLSPYICDDCDERIETRWRPSIRPQQPSESGVVARRSQHPIQSPLHATNQNARLTSEVMTGEYHLPQHGASLLAVEQQIPSPHTRESVFTNPTSVNNRQARQVRPDSPRSASSNFIHPGLPPASEISRLDIPETRDWYIHYGTEMNLCPRTINSQHLRKSKSAEALQTRTPCGEKLLSSTKIIVYDKEENLPYVTMFCSLKGA